LTMTVIVDIDGTVCDHSTHVWNKHTGDWDVLKAHCETVPPIPQMLDLVRELCWHYRVILMTSRSEILREATMKWVQQHQVNICGLVMRSMTDTTPDHIAKPLWAQGLGHTPDKVAFVLEDKQTVVDAFRAAGYICLQVAACSRKEDKPQPVERRKRPWYSLWSGR
jgi:beta-phosphoglucomutase-like phosphatase (HAD superfamily)